MRELTPEEKEKLQEVIDGHSADTPSSIQTVSAGRRAVNLIIDVIAFRIIIILLLMPLATTNFVQSLAADRVKDTLFGICLLFFYYFIFETLFQRTPGKLITGTKVIMTDGSRPGAGAIAIRTLCRFIPFEPLSGLFLGSWLHDDWSKTDVISARNNSE